MRRAAVLPRRARRPPGGRSSCHCGAGGGAALLRLRRGQQLLKWSNGGTPSLRPIKGGGRRLSVLEAQAPSLRPREPRAVQRAPRHPSVIGSLSVLDAETPSRSVKGGRERGTARGSHCCRQQEPPVLTATATTSAAPGVQRPHPDLVRPPGEADENHIPLASPLSRSSPPSEADDN